MPAPALSGLSARILERTLGRLERLRGELEDLQRAYADREDLPGIETLIGAMLLVNSEIERAVGRRARQLADNPGPEADRAFRQRVGGYLDSIETLMPYPLDIARRPHGRDIEALVPVLTKLASSISGGRDLIFEPGVDYEFRDSLIEKFVEYADGISADLAKVLRKLPHLTVISYPAQLDGDTLLHSVLAHEIAHLALLKVAGGEPTSIGEVGINASIDEHYPELQRELTGALASKDKSSPSEEQIAELLTKTRRRIKRWFTELACDSLALRMVGPAFLFALVELELSSNRWAQESQMPGYKTHPGLGWRVRRLIPAAREWFAADREGAAWTAGRRALEDIEGWLPEEHDEIGEVERRIIEQALGRLEDQRTVTQALGASGEYLQGSFATDLEIVWHKLEAGIPPAERILSRSMPAPRVQRGRIWRAMTWVRRADQAFPRHVEIPKLWSAPMDWRSVLNGAWVFWLDGRARSAPTPGEQRSLPIPPSATRDWREFNDHIRGTIELCGIHTHLSELRDQLDELNLPEHG